MHAVVLCTAIITPILVVVIALEDEETDGVRQFFSSVCIIINQSSTTRIEYFPAYLLLAGVQAR